MESSAKIILKNVNKIFKTRFQTIEAVKDFSLEIGDGEFVSILGPSGCGKSTIIRMIDGIIKPTSGSICVDGELTSERKRMPKEILKKIGFIFQQPNLLPWYNVRENIMLPLKIFGLSGSKWENRADELMEMVGLARYADNYPTDISQSMTQRAGVIRAMVYDPEILLMDEPFGSLDELTREQMDMDLLDIWRRTRTTIVFITHSIEEAVLLSSRIYVMATNPGRLTDVVSIDLQRPRSLEMVSDAKFIAYEQQLASLIGELDLSKIK